MKNNIFGEVWTKNETDFLIENYEKIGPSECSKKIKRTVRACQLKAKKLKLKYKELKSYYEKENLLEIVSKSNSYTSCLEKIGISNRPGNYETLKKYISLYNIDISHFYKDKMDGLKKYINFKKKPLVDILVKDSRFSRVHLKERLFKENIKINVCEICGQDENWMGKKISLILDHINGVNNDNRLENLRIVCPNCNASLETHCKGNKQKNIRV